MCIYIYIYIYTHNFSGSGVRVVWKLFRDGARLAETSKALGGGPPPSPSMRDFLP